MKLLTANLTFCLFLFINCLNAQVPSSYDANGKVKSVETRRYEESINRQNKYTPAPQSATTPARTTNAASTSSGYYNAAEVEAERVRKVKEAEAKAAFIVKMSKYDEADLAAYRIEGNNVRVKSGGKYGFVNTAGELVVPLIYDELASYYIGDGYRARVGNKWGFIDHVGKVIFPIKYDVLNEFEQVYDYSTKLMKFVSLVKLDGKYGYLGTQGETIIPVIYDELIPESLDDLDLYAARLNNLWGFIDNNGNIKIPFQFSKIIQNFTFPHTKTPENSKNGYFNYTSAKAIVIKNNARFSINIGGASDGPKTDIFTGRIIDEVQETGVFTDARDNREYKTIKIGEQVWMSENLDVAKFKNGDKISEADDKNEWNKANKKKNAAWCYYNNDTANHYNKGKLYNFFAVTDPRGLAPEGWHIPSKDEWSKLIAGLGGESIAWKNLMHPLWLGEAERSRNPSGFSARPAGFRNFDDGKCRFMGIEYTVKWWSATEVVGKFTNYVSLTSFDMREDISFDYGDGFSIRCIKDN